MVGKLPGLVDKKWSIISIVWTFVLRMVTIDQGSMPSRAQTKVKRHMISFIVVCACLSLFVVDGVSVYIWLATNAVLLPIYGLFIFKVIPHVVLASHKALRTIIGVLFTLMGLSLVVAMSGWAINAYITFALFYIILPLFLLLTVGISVEIHVLNLQQQKLQHGNGERERVMAERRFLKAQINPHFLFNTLNNILSMASRKSDKTPDAILLLETLVRRTVSMNTVEKIPLQDEFLYLVNYIDLQKLQRTDLDDLMIEFKVPDKAGNVFIEPLILIAFVENAFKHGVVTGMKSFISIILILETNQLVMHVSNTKFQFPGDSSRTLTNRENSSGVGLANARRRLDIGYPRKHKLNIFDGHGQYIVRLEIDL